MNLQHEVASRQTDVTRQPDGEVGGAISIDVSSHQRVGSVEGVAELARDVRERALADQQECLVASCVRVGVDRLKVDLVAAAHEVENSIHVRVEGVGVDVTDVAILVRELIGARPAS